MWLAGDRATIGDILKREGLIEARRRRRRALAQGEVVAAATVANEEWAIDFKGWFRTADGERCDLLTITDATSRYLIEVRIVEPTWAGVRGACEQVFEAVGLPEAIRSDNGSPFGSTGAGGLSALSVWCRKLGIEPRYIAPSSPQDNGRHERMHRTLKAQNSTPAAAIRASNRRGSNASGQLRRKRPNGRSYSRLHSNALSAGAKPWQRLYDWRPARMSSVPMGAKITWQGEEFDGRFARNVAKRPVALPERVTTVRKYSGA